MYLPYVICFLSKQKQCFIFLDVFERWKTFWKMCYECNKQFHYILISHSSYLYIISLSSLKCKKVEYLCFQSILFVFLCYTPSTFTSMNCLNQPMNWSDVSFVLTVGLTVMSWRDLISGDLRVLELQGNCSVKRLYNVWN